MKKSLSISIAVVVGIVAVILVTGFTGIHSGVTVAQETCSESYQHYAIKPWLHDWLECRRQQPCGVDEGLAEYNAKAEVVQCLCRDSLLNASAIVEYYNREIVAEFVTEPQPSNDAEFICTEGALPVGRL